jgi:hypothetical protein
VNIHFKLLMANITNVSSFYFCMEKADKNVQCLTFFLALSLK